MISLFPQFTRLIFSIIALVIFSATCSAQIFRGDRQWVKPYIIDENTESINLYYEMWIGDPDSVRIYFETDFVSVTQHGVAVDYITFYNDGNGVDEDSEDQIYSAENIFADNIYVFDGPYASIIDADYLEYYLDGEVVQDFSRNVTFSVRGIRSGELPEVFQVDSVQYTSHVFNTVIAEPEAYYLAYQYTSARTFYDYFPDDRQILLFTAVQDEFNNYAGGIGGHTKFSDKGVIFSDPVVDSNNEYGEPEELEAAIQFFNGNESSPNLLHHELFHKWGVAVTPEFNMTTSAHFINQATYTGNAMGGRDITDIIELGDSLYKVVENIGPSNKYSLLDLYLAGYISIDEVPFPLKVLKEGQFQYFDTDGNQVYFSEQPLEIITREAWLATMGPRIPNYQEARKDYNCGVIVISRELLTPAEMRYFHVLAEDYERDEFEVMGYGISYFEATHGMGRLSTLLVPNNTTSLQEIKRLEKNIVIQNPSQSVLNIEEGLLNQNLQFTLSNSLGETVIPLQKINSEIGVGHLGAGLYLITVWNEDRTFYQTQKVIISNY